MTVSAGQFPYLRMDPGTGPAGLSPYLPIELILGQSRATVQGLLDSGAAINVRSRGVFEIKPKSSGGT